MKIIYLKQKSNFKTELKSDTLWGIILNAIRLLYSDVETNKIIKECKEGNPPFLISSAMPYIQMDGERICFFPKPLNKPFPFDASTPLEMTYYKDFKKIKTVPKQIFEMFINAELSEKEFFEKYISEKNKEKECKKNNEEYKQPFEFYNAGIKSEMVLHNTIDRLKCSTFEINGEGQLFYTEEKYVKNGGLFFLIDGDINLIEPSLRLLSHIGIGGDSTVGKGCFEISFNDFELRSPENFLCYVTLSLYSPVVEEINKFKIKENLFWYNISFRSGKANSKFLNIKDFQKDISPMLTEGSSFPRIENRKFYGSIRPVLRNNNVELFSYGYAFPIPVLWKEVN